MNKITDDIIAVAKKTAIADKIVKPIQSQLQKPTLSQTQAKNVPTMRFKKSVTQPVTPFALPKKPEVVNVQKPTVTPTPISPALSGSPLVKAVAKKKDDKTVDVQEATKDFVKTDWGRVWDETVASGKSTLNSLQGAFTNQSVAIGRASDEIFEVNKAIGGVDSARAILRQGKEDLAKAEATKAGLAEQNRQIQTDLAEKYKGKEQSKFGTLAGQVSSGITQMIPMIVANAVLPGAGLPVMFAQVYESEYQSAKFDGASEEDAQTYGFFKGAIEAGTEYLFGGVPLMGEGLADTTGFKSWLAKGFGGLAEDSLMSMAQSELGKQFVSKAIDVLGEGAEEYISEVLGSVAVKAYKETNKGVLETLAESAGSKEAWDAWFVGSVTSAVMNLDSYVIGKGLQTAMKEKKLSTITPEQSFEIAKVIGEKLDTEVEWLETDDPNDSREGLYIPATEGQKAKIYLNPNSQKAVGTVAIHEIGHDLVAKTEGQDLVNEFLKTFYKSEELVDLYAKTQAKYQSAYNDQFIMKHSGLTQAQVDALDQTQYAYTLNQMQSKFKDLRQVEKNEILEEMFTKTLERVIDSPAGMRRLVTGNLTVAQKIRRQFASLGAKLAEDKKFFQLQEMEDLFNVYMEGYTDYVKMQKAQSKALQEEALAPKTELGKILAKPVMASVKEQDGVPGLEKKMKRVTGDESKPLFSIMDFQLTREVYPLPRVTKDKYADRKEGEFFNSEWEKQYQIRRNEIEKAIKENDALLFTTNNKADKKHYVISRSFTDGFEYRVTFFSNNKPWSHSEYFTADEIANEFALSNMKITSVIKNDVDVLNVKESENVEAKKKQYIDNIELAKFSIEDFGKKIGGARKDIASSGKINLESIEKMNDREYVAMVNKNAVIGKADYKKMVADGIEPVVALYVKRVRDSIAVKPEFEKDVDKAVTSRQYIQILNDLESALKEVKTQEDVLNFYQNFMYGKEYVEKTGRFIELTQKGRETAGVLNNKLFKAVQIGKYSLSRLQVEAESSKFGTDLQLPKGYSVIKSSKDSTYYVVNGRYILGTGFATEADAINSVVNKQVAKPKTANGKITIQEPVITNIKRTGVDYRKGKQIVGKDYLNEFGFSGGEFGNWENQIDRQTSLNYGYDGLHDLANTLKIMPKSISFGGTLSIAFGSRGVKGAKAHYEPLRKVINLTKMKGAGSLAHEWFHGLDDYIGTLSGITDISSKKSAILSSAIGINRLQREGTKLSPELIEAYKKLIDSTQTIEKIPTDEERKAEYDTNLARYKRLIDYYANDYKKLDGFDKAVELMRNGDNGGVELLSKIVKDNTGRVIPSKAVTDLNTYTHFIAMEGNRLKEPAKPRTVKTNFLKSSQYADGNANNPSGHGYWSSIEEMLARSFSTYLQSRMGIRSDYLEGGHSNELYSGGNPNLKVFPEGEELDAINEAFDGFFEALKKDGVLIANPNAVDLKKNVIDEESDADGASTETKVDPKMVEQTIFSEEIKQMEDLESELGIPVQQMQFALDDEKKPQQLQIKFSLSDINIPKMREKYNIQALSKEEIDDIRNKTVENAKNGRYGDMVEMVNVDVLNKFREYDRLDKPYFSDNIKKLSESIKKDGIKEYLFVEFNPNTGFMKLGEGNHRLGVANLLGLDQVPVLAIRSNSLKQEGNEGFTVDPEKIKAYKEFMGVKQYASNMKPSEVSEIFAGKEAPSTVNKGIHYGDMGVSETNAEMSETRDTGHFGTGTYFLSDNASKDVPKNFLNRPKNEIDLSKYNLFKPGTEKEGLNLHDGLKEVQVAYENVNDFAEDVGLSRSTALNYADTLAKRTDIGKLRSIADDFNSERLFGNIDENIVKNYFPDKLKKEWNRLYNDENAKVKEFDAFAQSFKQFVKSAYGLAQANEKLSDVTGFKFDSTRMQRIILNYDPTVTQDTVGTQYMKSLGYDGVDVRGFKGLDNTTYGSVLYQKETGKKTKPVQELDQTKIGEPLISEEEMDSMLDEIMKEQKDLGFDVKYSLKDAKEKNLVALHNLTEDKLMGLLDLGGIPVPSIAITRADIGHENFGDITIVMKPDVVDPKKTPVFSADAYSPRFPTMYEKADRKKLVEALKNFQTYDGSLYIEKYERTTHDKAVKELSKEMGAMINYLRAKGIEYKTEMKPYESKGWGITSSLLNDFIEQNPELEKINIYDLSVDEVMSKYKEKTLDLVKKSLAKYKDTPSFDFGFSDVDGVLSEVKDYIEYGKKSEQENIESTIKNIESVINSNKEDFRNWISEKLEGVYGDKVIVKPNIERFYPDGSRKPESAITLPATLENLVKTLKNKGKIVGEEAQGGQGVLNALLSTQFSSVSELKGSKSRLSDVQSVNDKIAKTNEKYYKLLNKLSATFTKNYGDDISVVLNDYVKETGKSRISEESFKNYMNKWHYNVDSKLSNETMSFFDEIKKLPTKYFEAKPQRAVNFNEIETALIPETANDKLIQKLDEKGISYIKYNDANDRKSIISTLDNAKFSLKDDIKFRQSEDFVPEKSLAESDLLTKEEQAELEGFIAYDDKLGIPENDIQFERYNELVLKAQGKVVEKFKGLKVPKSKEDVYNDPNFKAYKDAKFDPKVMNNALELVKGYRGTEKRTKDQWLMIANQIGANIKTSDPEALKKYAVQTWYANSPNQKDRLNRQGTKFNPFFIHEWVAEVYNGARVGAVTQVKQTQETEVNIPSDVKAVLEERGEPITQMIEQLMLENPVEETVEEVAVEPVEIVREEPSEEVAKLIEDIEEAERVRKHEQTIASTNAVTEKTKSKIEKDIDEGKFDYQTFSDKKAVRVADFNIKNDKNHALYNDFINKVENNAKITKQDIANAEMLIIKYSKEKGQSEKVYNLVVSVAVVGTELGQAVQAMSLIRKMSGVGQYMALEKIANKLNKQYEEEFKDQIRRTKKVKGEQVIITIDPALRQKLIETPTDDVKGLQEASEAIKQNIADQMPSTVMDKVTAWRYLSMLGNPRTHVRNLLGNALFVPLRIAKDGIAMVLERQLPIAERTKAIVPKALNKGIFEFAENDYAENIKNLQTGGKYNVSSDIERRKAIFKTKWLEGLRVKNFDFLEKEDAWFKHSSYVNAMAQFMKARKLTAETITDAQVAEARNHAYQVALKMTYQDASKLATTLNNLENSGGKFAKFAMSAVLPFKKTPINILKRGVEFSPVGLTLGLTVQMLEYKKGNITQAELIDSISAGMTGTGIALVGALMASMGWLNIDEDEDKKKSAFDKTMGFQKYSINVLGQSFTIDWAVPAVMPLFVGASIFKQTDEKGLNLFDANVLKDAMTNVFNPAFEMSMLEGLTNTLMSYGSSGAEKVGDMITTMGTSFAGQFVPTVSGQIARIIDQTQRSTYAPSDSPMIPSYETFLRRMANKIPLASMLNPEVINLRGEEVKQSDNILIRAFNNLLNPSYVASVKVTETDKELIKLFDLTKDNDAIPKTASKSFVANGETYRLDSDAYSAFAKTMGTTSYDLLQKLTQNKAYEAMNTEDRVTAVSRIYEYAQTKAKAEYLLSKGKRPSGKVFATYEKLKSAEAHGVSVADYVVAKQIHDGLGDMTISKKSALIVKLVNKGYNYEKVVFLVNNIDNYTLTESDKSLLKERIRARK